MMSDIEKKMLAELQNLVDFVQWDRRHNLPDGNEMYRLTECMSFAERVTGKTITVKDWKVMFKEA